VPRRTRDHPVVLDHGFDPAHDRRVARGLAFGVGRGIAGNRVALGRARRNGYLLGHARTRRQQTARQNPEPLPSLAHDPISLACFGRTARSIGLQAGKGDGVHEFTFEGRCSET
jgi:hypothetical protein